MSVVIDGSTGITTPTYGGAVTAEYSVPVTAFKNRLINGAMVIDQRNAGASVTANDGVYAVDRFRFAMSQSSKGTAGQNLNSVTPPVGFSNYLGFSSSSAYSVGSGDYFVISQKIEGFNFADMAWGTVNAKTVTLSFQVYSSLTGTFGGTLTNSAANRSYPFTYTVSSANTWTTVSVTIAGDQSGTWIGATNGTGVVIYFGLGVGSTYSGSSGSWGGAFYLSATGATSVVGTNGATFYITGVQLEKGSTATSFDYRPYGTELALCQRYYEKSYAQGTTPGTATTTSRITSSGNQGATTTGYIETSIQWKVTKRANPTVTIYDMAGNSGKCTRLSTGVGTTDNQTVTTSTEGEASSSVYSSGTASANCLQYHYTASIEL